MIALEEIRIGPQAGPQSAILSTSADIAIYGGAAGGGKTYALLLDSLRGIEDKAWKPVIFRRTYKQIKAANGLWDKACELYPMVGGRMRESEMDCQFPSGAYIKFSHMENENSKIEWQGTEIPGTFWDELTHFSESQFWYMVSRMRSMGTYNPYMRATCNPEPGSWVARLLEWWIDPLLGTPIPERAGVIRYAARAGDDSLAWGDTREELVSLGYSKPISFTFIPATLADNPALTRIDPDYADRLRALPRAERESLLGGNWLFQAAGVFDRDWFLTYSAVPSGDIQCLVHGDVLDIPKSHLRRFAVIDTAGTSRDRAEQDRGREPSWSVCQVWDYYKPRHMLFLRSTCRIQAEWMELKARFNDHLAMMEVPIVCIENAHFGPALAKEINGRKTRLIGPKIPGMAENHRGAKLERAVAAGAIARVEDGLIRIPDNVTDPWVRTYLMEHTAWQGRPDEVADQIDGTSYACYYSKELQAAQWGGMVHGRHGRT
jgi:hypothetical protein